MKKLIRILLKLILVVVLPVTAVYTVLFNMDHVGLLPKVVIVITLLLSTVGWSWLMKKTKVIPSVSTQKWLGIGFGLGYEKKNVIVVLPFIILELSW